MRGFWFMMEALLAGILLIAFLIFLTSTNISRNEEDPTALGYRTLEGLNRQGLLKPLAAAMNASAIDAEVRLLSFNHSVEICSFDSCIGQRARGRNVWVASYVVPGSGRYDPREVRLYLATETLEQLQAGRSVQIAGPTLPGGGG